MKFFKQQSATYERLNVFVLLYTIGETGFLASHIFTQILPVLQVVHINRGARCRL